MSLDIIVQGQILNVSEEDNHITVFGGFQYLFLYNKCCDTDVIIKLYNTRGYIKLYGEDLKLVKRTEDEVKIKGRLTQIKVLDKSGTLLHDFDVDSCAIVVTEKREDMEIDVSKPDEDIEEFEEK